jgi:sigma-B regulation protein RsbU (phosphoserine phosphatase)
MHPFEHSGFLTCRGPRLALIIADDQDWSVTALGEAIARAWPPGSPPPAVDCFPLERVADAAMLVPYDSLLVLGAARPRSGVARLVNFADIVEDSLTPAILLGSPSDPTLRGLSSDTVILLPATTPPHTLACVLHTLAGRQPAVRRLQTELRAAHFVHDGASAEISRLQEELLLAGHIQREFLPKAFPELPGLDFDVLYRPAGFVSGDVYDIVRLDEHHAGFVLADAMGHGVAAALLTLFITAQLSLKQSAADGSRLVPPGEALARLNTALCGARGGAARMASAIVGVIDARDGTATLAAAGHPPPVLVTREGPRVLDVSGTLLGVVEESAYDHFTVRMSRGDVLLLHTDGITAGDNPAESAVTMSAELCDPFTSVAGGRRPLAAGMADVAAQLDRSSGSLHQLDDVTLIALACRAPAADGRLAA